MDIERLFAWTNRWRLPMTLVFVVLIGGTAYLAYRSRLEPAEQLTAAGDPVVSPDDDAGADGQERSALDEPISADPDRSVDGVPDTVGDADRRDDLGGTAGSLSTSTSTPVPDPGAPVGPGSSVSVPATTPGATTTTRPPATTTTRPPTTSTTTTTTTTTTPPPVPPAGELVFIGDRMTRDRWDGPGLGGLTVRLWLDTDGDGGPNQLVAVTTTDGDGRYGFDAAPGCYVAVLEVPGGLTVIDGGDRWAFCLDAGESFGRADAVLSG